ncbi:general secretion pathway protein GspB [Duganella hordei]|uniref:general secretion pathway protein GspB n=1 Tax=Duganella hordei TaxID=2865934 RepID=UPI0030EA8D65
MSYILEALKKAQAERQLGTAPTLHAPTLQTAEQAAGANRRKPMMLALLGMGVVILVLVLLAIVLRPGQQGQPEVAQQAAAPAAKLPPKAPRPDLVLKATPAEAPAAVPLPPPVATITPQPRPQPAAAVQLPSKAAPEEPVMNLRDLPEPIQRSIPQIAVGGYIYSKNAADRLLLIDKVLRHEGEEVAPGLTLEKLQPKEAVFNFKGYRYRVPY